MILKCATDKATHLTEVSVQGSILEISNQRYTDKGLVDASVTIHLDRAQVAEMMGLLGDFLLQAPLTNPKG